MNANGQFTAPVCADYDAVFDRWVVVQTISPVFMQVVNGIPSSLVGSTFVPKDIEIASDTLFHVFDNQVSGFRLSDFSTVFSHVLTDAPDLRSLALRGPDVFVADFADREIWRVPLDGGLESLVADSLPFVPSAMVHDPIEDRLVLCGWGPNGGIYSVDPDSGAVTLLTFTALTNLSGIVIDCNGYFLVSSWLPDRITAFEPSFTQASYPLLTSGLTNPGGIGYDPWNNVLAIPNTQSTDVVFETIQCTSLAPEDLTKGPALFLFPNPATTDEVRVNGDVEGDVFEVHDATGRLVHTGRVMEQGRLFIGNIPSGYWTISIPNRPALLPLIVLR